MQAEILFRIAADDSAPRWQDSVVRAGGLFMVGDPKQSIYRFRGADVGSYSEARSTVGRLWPDNIIQITANFRRSEEHTSELQSLMRISYAVLFLKKKKTKT